MTSEKKAAERVDCEKTRKAALLERAKTTKNRLAISQLEKITEEVGLAKKAQPVATRGSVVLPSASSAKNSQSVCEKKGPMGSEGNDVSANVSAQAAVDKNDSSSVGLNVIDNIAPAATPPKTDTVVAVIHTEAHTRLQRELELEKDSACASGGVLEEEENEKERDIVLNCGVSEGEEEKHIMKDIAPLQGTQDIDWSVFEDDVSEDEDVFLRPRDHNECVLVECESESRVKEGKGGGGKVDRRKSKDEASREGVTTRRMRQFMQGWVENSPWEFPINSASTDILDIQQDDAHAQDSPIK